MKEAKKELEPGHCLGDPFCCASGSLDQARVQQKGLPKRCSGIRPLFCTHSTLDSGIDVPPEITVAPPPLLKIADT